MGCTYSADRKTTPMKARIQPIDSELRVEATRGSGYNQPKYVNNLRGISIKSSYPKGDVIPDFT
jgi:hypothetical protein